MPLYVTLLLVQLLGCRTIRQTEPLAPCPGDYVAFL